jgi:hypothetical protein
MSGDAKAAVWIVGFIALALIAVVLSAVERDRAVHLKAFECGYSQVVEVGRDSPVWKAP